MVEATRVQSGNQCHYLTHTVHKLGLLDKGFLALRSVTEKSSQNVDFLSLTWLDMRLSFTNIEKDLIRVNLWRSDWFRLNFSWIRLAVSYLRFAIVVTCKEASSNYPTPCNQPTGDYYYCLTPLLGVARWPLYLDDSTLRFCVVTRQESHYTLGNNKL